jgi:hypothetical protein
MPEINIYRLKFQLIGIIYKDTVINLQSDIDNIKICLSDSGLHNYYLKKIPYDSIRAKMDIKNDSIKIMTLASNIFYGCRLNFLDYLSEEEKRKIEKKFGFVYSYESFDRIDQYYLDQRQKEYNDIVYKYLDDKLNGNSRELISKEIYYQVLEERKKEN